MKNTVPESALPLSEPVLGTPVLKRSTLWLMTFSVCIVVANIYFAQPLLSYMADSFHVNVATMGLIAMLTQVGTAFGMLFFVPLGDSHERRSLTAILVFAAAMGLILTATAQTLTWLAIASFLTGATGATVHVIVPYAANLAPEKQRGKVIGFVFSGLLLGILLARTFSGYVGSLYGWRSVYWISAGCDLILAAILALYLPRSVPEGKHTWTALMKSIWGFVVKYPSLRVSALTGGLLFCGFSAFWTILVFFLETPPYHYGASVAGLFGLIGAFGALGAPLVGHFSDKRGPWLAILVAIIIDIVAYGLMAWQGEALWGLILGVILMDLGVQSGHVANQTRIYAIDATARSRLNTVYMVSYFTGGAFGSYVGSLCWVYAKWQGVCSFCIVVLLIALGLHLATRNIDFPNRAPQASET